jgi:hypothetical protein
MDIKESKREQWSRLMRDYERSGKRAKEWCAEVGCSHRSFEYWRYKVRIQETFADGPNAKAERAWIKAEYPADTVLANEAGFPRESECGSGPAGADSPGGFGGVNIFIGRIRVNVAAGFDRALLREVTEALS